MGVVHVASILTLPFLLNDKRLFLFNYLAEALRWLMSFAKVGIIYHINMAR